MKESFKPDWIIHYVQNHDCDICGKHEENPIGFNGFANIHTHGLKLHGHSEICIPLDIGMDIATNVLNTLGQRIVLNNEVFEEGYNETILANGYKVRFIKFDGDDMLYLILPDVNNNLPGDDKCEFPYSSQLFYAEIIHSDK